MRGRSNRLSWLGLAAVGVLAVLLSWSGWTSGLLQTVKGQTIEIYYGPEDRPGDKLVHPYQKAERYIYIAAYGITYRPGVKALLEAKRRGVDVRIITDGDKLKDRYQYRALKQLRMGGIPIKADRHDGLMHLKQVVVDDEVNTTGSMNLTSSGNRYNDERLNIIVDPISTAKARKKFLRMWEDSERYEPWR